VALRWLVRATNQPTPRRITVRADATGPRVRVTDWTV
jgi:hypothetical protein